jgi:hypothetical protein
VLRHVHVHVHEDDLLPVVAAHASQLRVENKSVLDVLYTRPLFSLQPPAQRRTYSWKICFGNAL